MKLTGPEQTKKRARALRATMSLPERVLWRELRRKQTGLRFRKQHPAGPYVLDFYCHEANLCIQIDGQSHDFSAARDEQRDRWLAAQGVRTVRIAASDVLHNLEGVIQHIILEANTPPPSRCA
ncbi:MAG TPA: endonuclease domain-containing protein [Sphingomicrobium sp.]|nr:endonuclease domain-containing protein [Sphingomicrobium sp.]